MFIVIKSEHYDCTNLICKKDTLEEAAAAVRESIAQRINKNYHTGLTGADITHENEERYRYSLSISMKTALLTTASPEYMLPMTSGKETTKKASNGLFLRSRLTSLSSFSLMRNTKASSLLASTTVSMRRLRK